MVVVYGIRIFQVNLAGENKSNHEHTTDTNTQIYTVMDVCKLDMFFPDDAHLNDITRVRVSSSV